MENISYIKCMCGVDALIINNISVYEIIYACGKTVKPPKGQKGIIPTLTRKELKLCEFYKTVPYEKEEVIYIEPSPSVEIISINKEQSLWYWVFHFLKQKRRAYFKIIENLCYDTGRDFFNESSETIYEFCIRIQNSISPQNRIYNKNFQTSNFQNETEIISPLEFADKEDALSLFSGSNDEELSMGSDDGDNISVGSDISAGDISTGGYD